MDALSSQALVAGYRAVLEAADPLPRFFPLYMTAAGTIPPARVLVLGAGVAGLQAIGTAKRLGAGRRPTTSGRPPPRRSRSMGGTFIDLDLEARRGHRRLRPRADRGPRAPGSASCSRRTSPPPTSLITTAADPRPAGAAAGHHRDGGGMRAGSVVVDLAAESGGNVEGVVAGQDVAVPTAAGDGTVTLVGLKDAPSAMPTDASRLYAQNVANLLALMTDGRRRSPRTSTTRSSPEPA